MQNIKSSAEKRSSVTSMHSEKTLVGSFFETKSWVSRSGVLAILKGKLGSIELHALGINDQSTDSLSF